MLNNIILMLLNVIQTTLTQNNLLLHQSNGY